MNESHGSFGESFLAAPLHVNNRQAEDKIKSSPQTVQLLNKSSISISNSQISENKDLTVNPLSMPQYESNQKEECRVPLDIKKEPENSGNNINKMTPLSESKRRGLHRRKNLNLDNRSFIKGEEADSYYDKRLKNWTINTTKSKFSSEALENMVANETKNFARKYLLKGILCERRGDFDEAKNNYNKAIELNLTNKDAYLFLGNLYLRLKEYTKAVEIFRKGASNLVEGPPSNFLNDSDSESANSLQIHIDEENLRVLCFMQEDEFGMSSICSQSTESRSEDLQELMEELCQSFRHNLCEAYLVWVRHLSSKGRYDEAIEKLQEIIGQSSSYSGDAFLCWGCILVLKQQFEEAAEKFSHVFKSSEPEGTISEKTVSEKYQLRRQKKYDELDEFRALKSKGIDLCRDKKFNEAVSVLEKTITLQPDSPIANWNIARALFYAGRSDETVPYLKKAFDSEHEIVRMISRGIITFTKRANDYQY